MDFHRSDSGDRAVEGGWRAVQLERTTRWGEPSSRAFLPSPDGSVSYCPAVGRTARWNAMAEHCGEVTWRCIGEVAGQPWSSIGGDDAWGVVKPSHADAARSASGQAEFTRVAQADGSLVKTDGTPDPSAYPALLSLTDVMATGWHAAVSAAMIDASSTATM